MGCSEGTECGRWGLIQDRLWKANPQAMAAASKRSNSPGELAHIDSDGDTWLTPPWILEKLGVFDLDPCATEYCPDRIAPWYFTKADNGLAQEWQGRVFMNPPFSNTAPWLEKHARHGSGVSLVPASVESQVWRRCVWPTAKAICLLHGRTRFCNPDGSSTIGRPLRSVALIAWSDLDLDILARADFAGVLLTQWRQL